MISILPAISLVLLTQEKIIKDPILFKVCQPMNPVFYLGFGGNIGELIQSKSTATSFVERVNQLDVRTHSLNQNSPIIGFLGIAGYRLNSILSFELYYSQSAWDYRITNRVTYRADRINEGHEQVTKRHALDFGPRVLVALPFHKYFSPYLLGGSFVQYFKETSNFTNALNAPTLSKETSTGWRIKFAQGFRVRSQLTKKLWLAT